MDKNMNSLCLVGKKCMCIQCVPVLLPLKRGPREEASIESHDDSLSQVASYSIAVMSQSNLGWLSDIISIILTYILSI